MIKLTEYQEQTLVKCFKNANDLKICEAFEVLFGQCYVGTSSGSVMNRLEDENLIIWVDPHTVMLTSLGRETAIALLPKWGNHQEDYRDVES